MDKRLKKYIILWLSQSISGLGSSITGFSLVLWAYGQSHSAMSISLMSFFHYVPYIFCSLFVGGFIDRHKKKTIMLLSDSIATTGPLIVFILYKKRKILPGLSSCQIGRALYMKQL